jgi:hypothetical protein
MTRAWPDGAATGVGSLPGTDIVEAVTSTFGELPDLPYLPELPDRGPGADMIGRTAGLLVDLPAELYAGRWRVGGRPGRDRRRIRDLLERDLDVLAEGGQGYTGPLKIQATGPWTLAAAVELGVGGALLADSGAVRDLAQSQLDEPALPRVLAGLVPTESGLGTIGAVDPELARSTLYSIVDRVGWPVVLHCCAAGVPVALLAGTGAAAIGLDLALLGDLDPVGEAVEAGLAIFAGAAPTGPAGTDSTGPVPGTGAPAPQRAPTGAQIAEVVRAFWHKLGFGPAELPAAIVVTPACGLAGADPGYARAVLTGCRDAGRRLLDER